MHKHQYTAPDDLFMQFRNKDRRSPAQAAVTAAGGGMIPIRLQTMGGRGRRPTLRSLNDYMASAAIPTRRQASIRRQFGYPG
jgi:hypothetical protein